MKKQMRKFMSEHSEESFSATGLARELGWKRSKKKKNFKAKSARRIAAKCGALIEKNEKEENGKTIISYNIIF
jgi:hypothetical protein